MKYFGPKNALFKYLANLDFFPEPKVALELEVMNRYFEITNCPTGQKQDQISDYIL